MEHQEDRTGQVKEVFILTCVFLSSLLILIDMGTNLVNEMDRATEQRTLSAKTGPPPTRKTAPTLSEEEMQQWTQRLQNHSDN